MNFLNLQLPSISNIHSGKKFKMNTEILLLKIFIQKNSKHFQDTTRDLLDPMVEFVRWCPHLESEPLKFLHNEMYSETPQTPNQYVKIVKKLFAIKSKYCREYYIRL